MGKVHLELRDGSSMALEFGSDLENLMTVAVRAGVPGIRGECGGAMACATCHVHVAPEWRERVGPASQDERELIDLTDDAADDSRLACQIWLRDRLDGLSARVGA